MLIASGRPKVRELKQVTAITMRWSLKSTSIAYPSITEVPFSNSILKELCTDL